jgi:hypothetical protein
MPTAITECRRALSDKMPPSGLRGNAKKKGLKVRSEKSGTKAGMGMRAVCDRYGFCQFQIIARRPEGGASRTAGRSVDTAVPWPLSIPVSSVNVTGLYIAQPDHSDQNPIQQIQIIATADADPTKFNNGTVNLVPPIVLSTRVGICRRPVTPVSSRYKF